MRSIKNCVQSIIFVVLIITLPACISNAPSYSKVSEECRTDLPRLFADKQATTTRLEYCHLNDGRATLKLFSEDGNEAVGLDEFKPAIGKIFGDVLTDTNGVQYPIFSIGDEGYFIVRIYSSTHHNKIYDFVTPETPVAIKDDLGNLAIIYGEQYFDFLDDVRFPYYPRQLTILNDSAVSGPVTNHELLSAFLQRSHDAIETYNSICEIINEDNLQKSCPYDPVIRAIESQSEFARSIIKY